MKEIALYNENNYDINIDGKIYKIETIRNIPSDVADELINKYKGEPLIAFNEGSECPTGVRYFVLDNGYVISRWEIDQIKSTIYRTKADFYWSSLNNQMWTKKGVTLDHSLNRIYYSISCKKIHCLVLLNREAEMYKETGKVLQHNDPFFRGPFIIHKTVYNEYLFQGNRLFQTKEELDAYIELIKLRTIAQRPEYNHIPDRCCTGRNIYGEDFINQIPNLIDSLAERIRAPKKIFNKSMGCLKHLERYFYRHLITDEFADDVFMPLMAYLGEVHRHHHKSGEWVMEYDPVFDCWNPDIRNKNGVLTRMDRPLHRILRSDSSFYYPFSAVVNHVPAY